MRPHLKASEQGAVFIHVAIGLVLLLGISAFVIDYGMMWVSRGQAQHSADAGALAGAVSLAFDGADPKGATAEDVAEGVAVANAVWGAAPGAVAVSPYSGAPCAAGPASCVRVDTYRDGTNSSALLPTWFGNLLGLASQGVRAMAVARAGVGDMSTCLKPWAVVDKWTENWEDGEPSSDPWTADSDFDKYYTSGSNKGEIDPSITPSDVYEAPTASSTGTGFHPFNSDGTYTSDYGRQITLKAGDNNDFQFGSGWFKALALGDCVGGDCYRDNIKGCVGLPYKIGDELYVDNEPGEKVGPTRQAVETDEDSLVNSDPYAVWDQTLNGGRGGIANSAFPTSPRIVAVPLVNPDIIAEVNKGGRTTVPVANIAGFFIEGMTPDNKGVVGRLVTMPGLMSSGTGPISPESAYLWTISLVR